MCDYNRRIATPQAQNRASSTPAQRLAMTRLRAADAEKRQQSGLGPDFLEALARGLSVLAAFGGERSQLTLSDVARVVDLPPATVRRAPYTMEPLGYPDSDGPLFRQNRQASCKDRWVSACRSRGPPL